MQWGSILAYLSNIQLFVTASDCSFYWFIIAGD